MNSIPKVSVVIPNYNHSRFLEKRIKNVLDQSFQDFELILVDDGSTDNSREIMEQFRSHAKVSKIIFGEQNSDSAFKQWNKGVREARGEYVWIAEADDFAELTLVEKLLAMLEKYPNAGIAYCRSWHMDGDSNITGEYNIAGVTDTPRWSQEFVNQGKNEIENYLLFNNTIPNASAVLFRRKLYLDAGLAPEDMRYAGDWLTWCKMLLQADVAYTPEKLNYARTHYFTTRVRIRKDKLKRRIMEGYRILDLIAKHTKPSPALWETALADNFIRFYQFRLIKIITPEFWEAFSSASSVDAKALRRFFSLIGNKISDKNKRVLQQKKNS